MGVFPLNQVPHFLNEVAELFYSLNGSSCPLFSVPVLVYHAFVFYVVRVLRLRDDFLSLTLEQTVDRFNLTDIVCCQDINRASTFKRWVQKLDTKE